MGSGLQLAVTTGRFRVPNLFVVAEICDGPNHERERERPGIGSAALNTCRMFKQEGQQVLLRVDLRYVRWVSKKK